VLPPLVKEAYRTARARALENASDAPSRLQDVRKLLAMAERVGAVDETLADIALLVDGFLELNSASETQNKPSVATAAATPSDAAPPPAAVVPTAADTAVTPPIAVYQPQPNVPPVLLDLVRRLNRPAAINVVINERGTVDDVIVTPSVTAAYDALIVAAARTWRYKPAVKGGVPIRFVNPVMINVSAK
jgi:TonB family protein